MQPPADPNSLFQALYNGPAARRYLRSALWILAGTLLVLGAAFVQFAFGLLLINLILAGFWKPANLLYTRLAGLETNPAFQALPAPGWFLALLAGQSALLAGLFGFSGIWLLATRGFSGQHLILGWLFR
jgi:hypothetical protein